MSSSLQRHAEMKILTEAELIHIWSLLILSYFPQSTSFNGNTPSNSASLNLLFLFFVFQDQHELKMGDNVLASDSHPELLLQTK